jgi:hypothetical protein
MFSKKKSFDSAWLDSISVNRNFRWNYNEPRGRSGGTLLGMHVFLK